MVSFSQNLFSKHNRVRRMAVRALPPRDLPDAGFHSLLGAQELGGKEDKDNSINTSFHMGLLGKA